MSWFNIIKNVISVKIYDGKKGMDVPTEDNEGWAGWIWMALHHSGHLNRIRHMDKGNIRQFDKGEIQTPATFMGVPIIAIYHGSMPARGMPEYLELRQPLPEQANELVEDIMVLWETVKKEKAWMMKHDKIWAKAVVGPFPSALEQYKKQLEDESKRMGGFLGRFKKPKM
jgi:hypothetical protein